MSQQAKEIRSSVFNLPNQLTILRLILTVVMFCLIPWGFYLTCSVLFILAAVTDWFDGYFARKYNLVTTLGRILDPFADKMLICGTFIFLVAESELTTAWYSLQAWMVVVIVARELLVTALRSFMEERGSDFSAKWSGKWKMGFQCVAASLGLVYLSLLGQETFPAVWLWWPFVATIWSTVVLTIYSGVAYVRAAVRLVQKQ